MHPRVAFREYYRQFRKLRRIDDRAFMLSHAIFIRNRRSPVGLVTIWFLQDDQRRPYIVLDRTRIEED